MSNVALTIGGRKFSVACAEGEETHVAALGRLIDGKLRDMGDLATQSEARMLLYAALLLADEVHELRGKGTQDGDGQSTQILSVVADTLENLASRLEAGAGRA